ncbi:MAG: histidine kinase [Rhodobacteraceae bacterium]|nr:histidine kinase [Paracoccaceae bacterium]
MSGKVLASFILIVTVIFGSAVWWFQTRAYYAPVKATAPAAKIRLKGLSGGVTPLLIADFEGIDADSSPLRFRACFTTPVSLPVLTERFESYEAATPLRGPGWFDCFDAAGISAALEEGHALAFLGEANTPYGIDRIVAIYGDGRGFAWPQMNPCGAAAFSGAPLPQGCPPAPDRN